MESIKWQNIRDTQENLNNQWFKNFWQILIDLLNLSTVDIYTNRGQIIPMKWMREYQDLSELVIRVMNKYTFLHNKQFKYGEEHSISFSESQVVEEILRNKNSNMTTLSKELGVTKAAVTKTMKKLELKGFIKRYKNISNNKEIFVSITDLGDRIYQNYQNYIYWELV